MEGGESTIVAGGDIPDIVDEIIGTIKEAAAGQEVVLIRLGIGKEVTISRVAIAKRLNAAFPRASVELKESKASDSITVKDIEVE